MADEDLSSLDEADGGGGAGGRGQPGRRGPPVGTVLHHLLRGGITRSNISIVHQSVTVLVARSYLLHGKEALADGPQHSLVVVFAPEALREVRIQILSFSKPKSALNCLNRMG